MSCEDCDKRHDGSEGVAYYRWGIANVGMLGCDKHLREIFDALNEAQRINQSPDGSDRQIAENQKDW